MYKKLEITLVSTQTQYLEEETAVTAKYKLTDPSEMVNRYEEVEGEQVLVPTPREYGIYSTEVSFEAGYDPTKEEINSAVNDKEGIVSTY